MLLAMIEIVSAVFEMRKELQRTRNAGAIHTPGGTPIASCTPGHSVCAVLWWVTYGNHRVGPSIGDRRHLR